jgi:CheY-like chemotaxis protein
MSILIVEDNPISLRTVEMILQSHGLETVSAKSGRQAIEALQGRNDVQLILSDLMMPDMDGYELLETLSRTEDWKVIPVIVMTSLSDADTVRKVVSLGCKSYVVKPVREEALLPKVKQLMLDSLGSEQPLKAKFKVLEETGLTQEKFEELFDSFYQLVREAVKAFEAGPDPVGKEDAAGKLVLGLREGAAVLAQGKLPTLLEAFRARGACDWTAFRSALSVTAAAMAVAVEKRDRLREKLAGRSDSVAPTA